MSLESLNSSEISQKFVEKILSQIAQKSSLISYTISPACSAGDGFSGCLNSIQITYKYTDTDTDQELCSSTSVSVVVKTIPKNEFQSTFIRELGSFDKEIGFYCEIVPNFAKFFESRKISSNFQLFPQKISADLNRDASYIVLDDLRKFGYSMCKSIGGLDLDHTLLILKNLAKFHAISYAEFGGNYDVIMEKYPFLSETLYPPVGQSVSQFKQNFLELIKGIFKIEKELLAQNGCTNEVEKLDQILNMNDQIFTKLHSLCGEKVEKAVIIHGDCWQNNLMFKYTDNGQKLPVDSKFLDFQVTRCCSRVLDISHFLYTSAQLPVLLQNYQPEEKLLKIYFAEFVKSCEGFGVDTNDIGLDYKDFLKEFEHFKFYGVVMGLIMTPTICSRKEELPDYSKLNESTLKSTEGIQEFYGGIVKNQLVLEKLKYLIGLLNV